MSNRRRSSHRPSGPSGWVALRPEVCARSLGEHIRIARSMDDRPLEQIAPLAALTVSEWEAIEAGQVPDTWEQICLIAAALYLDRRWMARLVRLYVGAGKG